MGAPLDITDLTQQDRQEALWTMSCQDLRKTLETLMDHNRPTEQSARLDAITIYMLRGDAP